MPFGFAQFPVLAGLVGGADLQFVDIGGRGSALSVLATLSPYADYFVSEPDREEADRLRVALPKRRPWRRVVVMDEAIGSSPGTATLYLTRSPGMSSLLEPNRDECNRFYLGDKFLVVDTATVPMLSLDEAATRYGFTEAAFLKVDTQGTELDILRSGAQLLNRSVVSIQTEAEFRPFYKGQPLFADLDGYLREQGFSLVSLDRTILRRAGYRPTIYSRRTVVWAHCLYVREPDSIASSDRDQQRRQFPRLLVLAVVFNDFDLAFAVVDRLRDLQLLDSSDLIRLTQEVEQIAAGTTERLLGEAHVLERKLGGPGEFMLAPSLRDKRRPE